MQFIEKILSFGLKVFIKSIKNYRHHVQLERHQSNLLFLASNSHTKSHHWITASLNLPLQGFPSSKLVRDNFRSSDCI